MRAHAGLLLLIALFGVLAAILALDTDSDDLAWWNVVGACVLVQTVAALRARRRSAPIALHVGVASATFMLATLAVMVAVAVAAATALDISFPVSALVVAIGFSLAVAAASGAGVVAITAALGRLERRA
jgi:hypothetical protein